MVCKLFGVFRSGIHCSVYTFPRFNNFHRNCGYSVLNFTLYCSLLILYSVHLSFISKLSPSLLPLSPHSSLLTPTPLPLSPHSSSHPSPPLYPLALSPLHKTNDLHCTLPCHTAPQYILLSVHSTQSVHCILSLLYLSLFFSSTCP